VRENPVFWNASGVGVHFGLFSGAEIHTESLKSILAGGIAFATPDDKDMGIGPNKTQLSICIQK
jgi:paraquat-inducible protein B